MGMKATRVHAKPGQESPCKAPGCELRARTQGFCMRHWHAAKRYGDPLHRVKAPKGQAVNVNGYALEPGRGGRLVHRAVMAEILGRPLRRDETVHHKNGDRLDNRPENLELWTTHQPKGQRVADKLAWAKEIIELYDGRVAASKDRPKWVALNTVVNGEEPPTEFRIFAAGKNESSKGSVIFDDEAAKRVLADYASQGNELMIDYDHYALETGMPDPAQAGKAAGWFNLEVRDGELWAVNVRWTEPAAEALRRREWRYISPAFYTDKNRVTSLINVALTNLPATKKLQPLMAASERVALSGGKMDPKKIKEALEAIKNEDAGKALEILESMLVDAAGGMAVDEPPAGEGFSDAPPMSDEDKQAVAAGMRTLVREGIAAFKKLLALTGEKDLGQAIAKVETWKQTFVELSSREEQLEKERETLEANERRKLVGELVKLGIEIPATAWKEGNGSLPCDRLQKEPIAELRARVAALSKARGVSSPKKGGGEINPPQTDETHGLTERELEMCTRKKIDPAAYAKTRAGIRSRSPGGAQAS